MILNQSQYSVTKDQVVRLQKALKLSMGKKGEMNERIFDSMIAGLKSQISELKGQLKEYEWRKLGESDWT